jgi:hypothetical protein
MVHIFIIGSSLEIIIYVLRNKFLNLTKELGPFIIISFVENIITIRGFLNCRSWLLCEPWLMNMSILTRDLWLEWYVYFLINELDYNDSFDYLSNWTSNHIE